MRPRCRGAVIATLRHAGEFFRRIASIGSVLTRWLRPRATMAFRIRPSFLWVILLALTALGAFAAVVPTSSPRATGYNEPDSLWRKTKDGWEIAWWLQPPKTFHKPVIHPLAVAACQLLVVSLLGLINHHQTSRDRQSSRVLQGQSAGVRRIDKTAAPTTFPSFVSRGDAPKRDSESLSHQRGLDRI